MATVDLWGAEYSKVPAVDLPNGEGGTTRFHEVTGNIDIDDFGVIDVTQYATATVPELECEAHHQFTYRTQNNQRRCDIEAWSSVDEPGFCAGGGIVAMDTWLPAVAANTTVTPTESAQTIGGADYMMEGPVTVSAIPSNYVGSGVTRRSSTDLSASGATVTAPAGYYESGATKTVASGTEGTPTATKGTVANNSVTVTPSVTNTAGYVSGGTHTGTAVTVTASELVSGSQTITQNGPVDVTNLEEVVVNVSGGGGGITTEVIFPEQSVTATTPDATGYTANINVTERLTEGENYIVTMDGTSYLCYAHAKYGGTDIYLGDDNVIWGNASQAQYPFCCATWGNGTTAWGVANTSAHTVKIEKVLSFDSAELGTKTITQNGTYSAEDDGYDGYSSVTVNVSGGSPTIQSLTVTPSTSQQTFNASGVDGYKPVTVNAIPSEYIIPTGNKAITANGTNIDVAQYATVSVNVSGGSSKNVQVADGMNRVNTTSYTAVSGQSIEVAVAGTYDVYWTGYRSSTSGTSGTQLYINETAHGTAQTSFSNNGQSVHLTGVSLAKNDVVAVYARARGTQYYMYAGDLTIVQTS